MKLILKDKKMLQRLIKFLNKIKSSPFKEPVKKYYLGKIVHGTPYFFPMGFCSTIISVRKLRLRSLEDYEKQIEMRRPYLSEAAKYELQFYNLPLARRTKNKIVKVFNQFYYIEIGWPFSINNQDLGWKDKYDTPRFESSPGIQIFFFKWQFCVMYKAPTSDRHDSIYWEMLLWYLYYADQDIKKAEETWPWVTSGDKKSTWNKTFLK